MSRFFLCFINIILVFSMLISSFSFTAAADDINKSQETGYAQESDEPKYVEYLSSVKDKSIAKDSIKISVSDEISGEDDFFVLENKSLVVNAEIAEDARYNIALEYKVLGDDGLDAEISLQVDGEVFFPQMKSVRLARFWKSDGQKRVDSLGNEFAAEQVAFDSFTTRSLYDSAGVIVNPYEFYLSKGSHKLNLTAVSGKIAVKAIYLSVPDNSSVSYKELSESYKEKNYNTYSGKDIFIEGENEFIKNAKSIIPLSDNSSAYLTPADPVNTKVNYIGSTNWQNSTEEIVWKVNVPEDGLYKLGFMYKQTQVVNGVSYRRLRIDGYTPFEEAANIGFNYDETWSFKTFANQSDEPYLFYLTKGDHELSLAVTMGPTADFYARLKNIVKQLGDLYLDIIMITGEAPDTNRDYELFKQIPGFNETLSDAYEQLESIISDMKKLSGNNTNDLVAALQKLSRVVKSMHDNPYTSHTFLSDFHSNYTTTNSWLYEMTKMPLNLDRIVLASPDKEFSYKKVNFFERLSFSFKRFLVSFTDGYNGTYKENTGKGSLKIWVSWGRDQAQVFSNMVRDSFTTKTGIPVNVEFVNADLIRGMLSNNQPDLSLSLARSAPVNLAMRGALYDLSKFPDYEEIMKERFVESAGIPYEYNGGHYALPEQQSFYLMFYRTDILEKMDIEVPNTWDEFLSANAVLQRNNMMAFIPYTKIADANTTNVGIGGLNLFASILMQYGGKLYNDDLNKSTLTESKTLHAFTYWSDFYKLHKFPVESSFYNRFREGTCPLGIAPYTQYTSFLQAAPEIKGRWDIALVPGIMAEDGTINRTVSGAGTGCSILEKSENKQEAWEFLKWWTDTETQIRYNSNVEAILGSVSRVATANIDAFSRLGWDKDHLEILMAQLNEVQEIPEVPGSYYLSRSVDQAFWSVYNGKATVKDSLTKWAREADSEIRRKIDEYS